MMQTIMMLLSEKVYVFSQMANVQLHINTPFMTFTQQSLFAYLTSYLHDLQSLDEMKTRTRELFDIFIQQADVTSIYPESGKQIFRRCIDAEVGAEGLAKCLHHVPHAFGEEFVFIKVHQRLQ
jgi:hypothetical protein